MISDGQPDGRMHYSALLVKLSPDHWTEGLRQLGALSGLDIHHVYPESGKVLVVQETESRSEQEEGLRQIQALPCVLYAGLVQYRVEEYSDPELLSSQTSSDSRPDQSSQGVN